MQWARAGEFFFASDTGYRIAVSRRPSGYVYAAFAPEIPYDQFRLMLREHYPRGVTVPQQREPLGYFSTAEDARRACQSHADRQPRPPSPTGTDGAA